ncbi:TerB family tellurite resistance protein [Sphingobacterium endophyticum]|uniref:TerB family tellurite resistance protein n=1 Tax=Sphingobacterium endophyticum TaxID=2546448 RepID=UPI0012E20A55|nr:TerB family tellurite resistance protein [Sphingobacterium endophyticum]
MKTFKLYLFISTFLIIPSQRAFPQRTEISQLLLNVEKLTQMKKILYQMKQGYSILSKGYGMVTDLSRGNFNLHRAFLQGLMKASPTISKYHKVDRIAILQIQLVRQSRQAVLRYRKSGRFTLDELDYLSKVRQKVLEGSLAYLQELTSLLLDGEVQMNDGERLSAIDRIHAQMEDATAFLRGFLHETDVLMVRRGQERKESERIGRLFGRSEK